MSGKMAPVLHALRFLVIFPFAAAILAALYHVPQPQALALALAALGGFVMAQARLRQWGLALAAALAPFPGILWFGTSAYALIIAFTILAAAAFGDARLKGEDGAAALWQPLPALAGTLLLAILWSLHAPVQLSSLMATAAATILSLPALLLMVGFGEDAIMRGNRQREKALRFFAFAARIIEPRWSVSLTGTGVVLAVLGYFQIASRPLLFDGLAACGAAILVLILARGMRAGLAALAASGLLLLFAGGVGGSLLLFLLFALVLGRSTAAWTHAGESEAMAWTRTVEEQGATILFAGLAAIIAALPRGGALAALHAGYSLVAVILFVAFAGALRALFPRRRRLDEIYRAVEHRPGKV